MGWRRRYLRCAARTSRSRDGNHIGFVWTITTTITMTLIMATALRTALTIAMTLMPTMVLILTLTLALPASSRHSEVACDPSYRPH